MDDEVDAEAGRGIDRAGSQGVGDDGRKLLKASGYSLQANAKPLKGNNTPTGKRSSST